MNTTNIINNWDIIIVRPYVTLPDEGAGIDRYISLHKKINDLGFKCLLISSTFHHNNKKHRTQNLNQYNNIVFIESGSYSSNHSFSRVFYEFYFMLRSYFFLRKITSKAVLIGEPVFGSTLFAFLMKFRKSILICDVIDLIPEALKVKIRLNLLYQSISIPLRLIRSFRLKFLSDYVSVVSESYKTILNLEDNKSGVFYWGLNKINVSIPLRDNKVKRVVYAGSLGDGYDVDILINLARKRDDIQMFIAGSGPNASACIEADKKGYLTYLGQVGEKELHELYLNSDIGILPYKKNSAVAMPIKFFDYIKYNLQILTSLDLESTEIILKNQIGCNYEPENLNSLSKALDIVVKQPCSKDNFGSLKDFYDLDKQYDNFSKKIMLLISKSS